MDRFNLAEMVAISNAVLEADVIPAAERMADRARSIADSFAVSGTYRDSITVVAERRPGVDGWGRAIVTAKVPYGVQVEARHGVLAKAAGGA